MVTDRRQWAQDAAERILWTGMEAVVAAISVDQLGLPSWAVAPVAVGLAMIKTLIAKRVGDPQTAAILP